MKNILLIFIFCLLLSNIYSDHFQTINNRIKGDDEPRLVSWKVLEGVTEPFESYRESQIPAWKIMKNAADQKAASLLIQQALHEYGQLLRHPFLFGEMPMEERYDVFLSMSKLLKRMGFQQRAELLLYEAMAYAKEPHEAHLQLALLFLDKENIEMAKLHFKNCLFYQETDLLVLIHLTAVLITENKIHESKFFISRVLSELERRVNRLSVLTNTKAPTKNDFLGYTAHIDHISLSNWLQDLLVKVFHGDFRVTPSGTLDLLKFFSNLYSSLENGEMTGRFIFDIGQSLFEGGRPIIGYRMMLNGYETSDQVEEGVVSANIVNMRLILDVPVIPNTLLEIIESYLNMTTFLSLTAQSYTTIELENIMDIYWPLPLLYWTCLPINPIMNELLWRFDEKKNIYGSNQYLWLKLSDPYKIETNYFHTDNYDNNVDNDDNQKPNINNNMIENKKLSRKFSHALDKNKEKTIIEIGILSGHMNNHPVGHAVLLRLLGINEKSTSSSSPIFHITLIALPLIPDYVTKRIASSVTKIINLPMDTAAASKILDELNLDIILYPDWQPFPDLQAAMLRTRRLAPIQICFFVRGSSCSSLTMDYYLLPSELDSFYFNQIPASSIDAIEYIQTNNKTTTKLIRQPWLEAYNEQVVLLDWPVLTSSVIHEISKSSVLEQKPATNRRTQSSSGSQDNSDGNFDDTISNLKFTPLEVEGQIFFEGQPVAIIPIYPTNIHPIMDDVIFEIMHSITSLQVVIVLSDSFFSHLNDSKHKMIWARKLVRRLWAAGGNLYHRIRLLPTPLNDMRMLQILRQADFVLDTFPIGSSFHVHALSLSVGTPIVTLKSGIKLKTPKEDINEIRKSLKMITKQKKFESNPLHQLLLNNDSPWMPSVSTVAGFYDRIGLSDLLIANSTSEYIRIAKKLAINKESSYDIRIKILEAVDENFGYNFLHEKNETNSNKTFCSVGSCVDDLAMFLKKVGRVWAKKRVLERSNRNKKYSDSIEKKR